MFRNIFFFVWGVLTFAVLLGAVWTWTGLDLGARLFWTAVFSIVAWIIAAWLAYPEQK